VNPTDEDDRQATRMISQVTQAHCVARLLPVLHGTEDPINWRLLTRN
jgi:hypothetical protein